MPPQLHARQGATRATCLPGSEWMNNREHGQSPCLVASWAVVPCRGSNAANPWVIDPMHPYLGPTPTSDLFRCRCNTVFYSLLAACGACQGYHGIDGIENFTVHMADCPPGYIVHRQYPQDIPPEVTIPDWAYLDVVNDQWNEAAASALALQDPESATSKSASASSATVSPDAAATRSPVCIATRSAPSAHSTSGQSYGVVGPAVGGAIGGVAILLLMVIAILMYLRRRPVLVSSRHGKATTGAALTLPEHPSGGHHAKPQLYLASPPRSAPSDYSTVATVGALS
ncbi:hypothetical protein C8Q76DRAFT_266734 [Earliella scabrosa]|nr:hypothetical protein C8Q76DRAFT_266734 [Earliella scabrosa]